jgi:hypothetical protein
METRFEMLERRLEQSERGLAQAQRRFRATCGLAVAIAVCAVLLEIRGPVAAEQAGGLPALAARVAVVEAKLSPVALVPGPCAEVVFSGVNVRIVNGLGSTETKNGCGNLIVGYNELRSLPEAGELNFRSGSHNVIVGSANNYSSYGGLAVGRSNDIYGPYSGVTAGVGNVASGYGSSVSGGFFCTASGDYSSVSGGGNGNTASGYLSSVSGGSSNTASGEYSSVSGGYFNTAMGGLSSVSGGQQNHAGGYVSSVSGGLGISQFGLRGWSGGLFHSP